MTTTEFQCDRNDLLALRARRRNGGRAASGMQNVDVSAATGRLVVTSTAPVEEAQVLAAVEEAGYQAVRST